MSNGAAMSNSILVPKKEYKKLKEKARAFDQMTEKSEWKKYSLKHALEDWDEADELIKY